MCLRATAQYYAVCTIRFCKRLSHTRQEYRSDVQCYQSLVWKWPSSQACVSEFSSRCTKISWIVKYFFFRLPIHIFNFFFLVFDSLLIPSFVQLVYNQCSYCSHSVICKYRHGIWCFLCFGVASSSRCVLFCRQIISQFQFLRQLPRWINSVRACVYFLFLWYRTAEYHVQYQHRHHQCLTNCAKKHTHKLKKTKNKLRKIALWTDSRSVTTVFQRHRTTQCFLFQIICGLATNWANKIFSQGIIHLFKLKLRSIDINDVMREE